MNISSSLRAAKGFVTSNTARQVLKVQKNAPNLLFGAGIVGVVGTAVLASKATLELEAVFDEHDEKLAQRATLIRENHPKYTADKQQKDLVLVHTKTAMKIAKLYAPAVIVGAGSIACLAGSHNMLIKRNASLTAAYVALDKGFKQYRARVVEEFGEEKDKEFRYGTEEVVVRDDSGKIVATKKGFDSANGHSIYAKLFGPDNDNWNNQPEYNLIFLRAQQNYLNDRLRAKGHVFLNEVYDNLGLERTPAGQIVGWVWRKDGDNGGDNFIDFGVWSDDACERLSDFVVGREEALLLDFNVDGPVFELI